VLVTIVVVVVVEVVVVFIVVVIVVTGVVVFLVLVVDFVVVVVFFGADVVAGSRSLIARKALLNPSLFSQSLVSHFLLEVRTIHSSDSFTSGCPSAHRLPLLSTGSPLVQTHVLSVISPAKLLPPSHISRSPHAKSPVIKCLATSSCQTSASLHSPCGIRAVDKASDLYQDSPGVKADL